MKISAGLLLFRRRPFLEVLVAHLGGPFWVHRDEGAWSVIKGEVENGEETLAAALREYLEETGHPAPEGEYLELGEGPVRSGKRTLVWAIEADFDPSILEPGTFTMHWRGEMRAFPEIDRVAWLSPEVARTKMLGGQSVFIDRLEALLELRNAAHG